MQLNICGIYSEKFFPVHGEEREGREGEGESSHYRISQRIQKFPILDLLEKAFGDVRRATFDHKQCIRDLSSAFQVLVSSVLIQGPVTGLVWSLFFYFLVPPFILYFQYIRI
jgi:hypothetical protein